MSVYNKKYSDEEPSADGYKKALGTLIELRKLNSQQKGLLLAWCNARGHSASAEDLARAAQYKGPIIACQQIGKIGHMIAMVLGRRSTYRYTDRGTKGELIWLHFVGFRHGYDDDCPRRNEDYGMWVMNGNLVTAIKELRL